MTKHGEPAAFLAIALAYEGDECLIWPYGRSTNGDGVIFYEGRSQPVARILCKGMHGTAPSSKHEAAHSCGNGHLACCTKRHLDWKTPKANAADKLLHGTHSRGERCGTSKLLESEAREILSLNGQMTIREIAGLFDVSETTVRDILKRKTWAWLD